MSVYEQTRKAGVAAFMAATGRDEYQVLLAEERAAFVDEHGKARGELVEHTTCPACGADDPHAAFTCFFEHLFFKRDTRCAGFFESGGDDNRPRNAFRGAVVNDAGDRGRRRDDHGQIDFFGDIFDARIGFDAEHVGPFGIDRVYRATERIGNQIF